MLKFRITQHIGIEIIYNGRGLKLKCDVDQYFIMRSIIPNYFHE
jgi:hypothetical protein